MMAVRSPKQQARNTIKVRIKPGTLTEKQLPKTLHVKTTPVNATPGHNVNGNVAKIQVETRSSPTESLNATTDTSVNLLAFGYQDAGNADRIRAVCGDHLRYCAAFKSYLVYDGRRWTRDSLMAVKFAKLVMTDFFHQAVTSDSEKAEKFAKYSLNDKGVRAALRSLECEVPIKVEQLDTNPNLLNFENGTVDLCSGELQSHDPEDFIARIVPFDFDPKAKCPEYLKLLKTILPDRKVRDFVLDACGYGVTGHTSEKCVFFCVGDGDNGKTTFVQANVPALGPDYTGLIQIESLMATTPDNNALADLADLRGTRLAITSETNQGQQLNEARLKRITQGNGKIKSARKYEHWIEFTETHKLWIDANHLPRIAGTDSAIWNRLRTVPFEVTIPKEEQDPTLPERLRQEGPGIVALFVRQAVKYYNRGLPVPPAIVNAVRSWREESDTFGRFINECCELDKEAQVRSSTFREVLRKFCEEEGLDMPLPKSLIERLSALGVTKTRHRAPVGGQVRMFKGVRLRSG